LPAAAGAGVVAPGLQRGRGVEEVPAAIALDEGGALAVAVLATAVVPAGGEGDEGVFGLGADQFAAFHLQPQPGAAEAPGADAVPVEAGLLGGQGGGDQVVDQAQHVGAVARAHQVFGAGRRGALVIVAAAGVEGTAAAAGAGLAHGITTSTCRSFR